MQHFTSLRANVKDQIDTGLDACTALIGPARSYKTAILDAVRLALTGRHPVGATPSALLGLLSKEDRENGLPLTVSLQGVEGFCEWTLPMDGQKPKKPGDPVFTGKLELLSDMERSRVVPEAPIKDLLTGAAKGREALIARFGQCLTLDPPSGLSRAQRETWKITVGEVRAELERSGAVTEAEVLSGLAGAFRRAKIGLGTEIGGLKKAIERGQAALASVGGSEVLEALMRQLAQAELYEKFQPRRLRLTGLQAERVRLDERETAYKEAVSKFRAAEADAAADAEEKSLDQQKADLVFGEGFLVRVRRAVEGAKTGSAPCPCCGQQWGLEAAKVREAKIASMVDARRASVAKVDTSGALAAEKARLRSVREGLRQDRARIDSGIEELVASLETSGAPPTWDGPEVSVLRAQVATLQNVDALRTRVDADADRVAALEAQRAVAAGLEKRAGTWLMEKLAEVRLEAESVVNRYMPAGYVAALHLDTGLEWRVLDEDEEGHGRGAMCGTELGALMVALSLAWNEGSPLRVMLLDDPDLGLVASDAVPAVLGVVRDAVRSGTLTQAIVALSRADEVPEGWTRKML